MSQQEAYQLVELGKKRPPRSTLQFRQTFSQIQWELLLMILRQTVTELRASMLAAPVLRMFSST